MRGAYHNHLGFDNIVENNIFVDAGEKAVILNNQEASKKHLKAEKCRIVNNIIYDTSKLNGVLRLDIRSQNNIIEGNKVLTSFGRKIKEIASNNKDINNTQITEAPKMRSVLEIKAPLTKTTKGTEE